MPRVVLVFMLGSLLVACGDDDASGDLADASPDSSPDSSLDGSSGPARDAQAAATDDAAPGDGGARADAGRDASVPDARVPDASVPGGDEPDPISLDVFCEDIAGAVCDWFDTCRSFGAGCAHWPQWARVVATCQAAKVALSAGRIDFDGLSAARCVAAHRVAACEGPPPIVFTSENPALAQGAASSCLSVFAGRIGTGEDCYTHNSLIVDECEAGTCYRDQGECPGTCEPLRELDESCSPSLGRRCEPDLVCHEGTCVPRALEGEDCSEHAGCAAELSCVRAYGEQTAYECHHVAAEQGDACAALGACPTGSICVEGFCADSVATGELCLSDDHCMAGERCLVDANGELPLRCRAPIALGEPCFVFDSCAAPARCYAVGEEIQASCRAPGEIDEPCQGATCADGLYCSHGAEPVCALPQNEDEPCDGAPGGCAGELLCMADELCHPRGGLGDPCNTTARASCANGLFCDLATQACAEPSAQDELCNPGEAVASCAVGLYCNCVEQPEGFCPNGFVSPPDETYACVVQLEDGDACTVDAQCASGNCASNLGECAPPSVGEGFVGCVGP